MHRQAEQGEKGRRTVEVGKMTNRRREQSRLRFSIYDLISRYFFLKRHRLFLNLTGDSLTDLHRNSGSFAHGSQFLHAGILAVPADCRGVLAETLAFSCGLKTIAVAWALDGFGSRSGGFTSAVRSFFVFSAAAG